MNHATVKLGEFVVPLIGIPVSATEMECECCHEILHITKVHLDGKQFLCEKCRLDKTPSLCQDGMHENAR